MWTLTHEPEPRRPASRRRAAAGFTLIEAALTTVIVGTGVLAIVAAQQAYHAKNQWAVRTGTAMLLANEIRELTMTLPYRDPQGGGTVGAEEGDFALWDDLDDFAGDIDAQYQGSGVSFSAADGTGPVNALREQIPDMEGWRQHVLVEAVLPSAINVSSDLTQGLNQDDTLRRVTVNVYYQGPNDPNESLLTSLSWIVVP